jgi:hypothetical protein
VLTAGGVAPPVVWVDHGRVLATWGRQGPATPVIVCKGALGANAPHTDLRVTKGTRCSWMEGRRREINEYIVVRIALADSSYGANTPGLTG